MPTRQEYAIKTSLALYSDTLEQLEALALDGENRSATIRRIIDIWYREVHRS